MWFLISIIISLIIVIIGILAHNKEKILIITRKYDKIIEKLKQDELDKYIQEQKEKLDFEIRGSLRELERQRDFTQAQIETKQAQLVEMTRRAQQYEQELREAAKVRTEEYESVLKEAANGAVNADLQKMREAASHQYEIFAAQKQEVIDALQEYIYDLNAELGEKLAKQQAINEAIRRQRELEEQQDFYRVCLSEDALSDVSFLQEVRKNLKKPEIIDKIIYDNYIAKPVLDMIKRVLQNSTCSGIYKITCTKTGEIYIGKSTDVKNRWQQHCKTVFNCGTIASSFLHTKMKQHGIENFTFELLETVSKDQLTEREKYYINFYQTKEVGLNERNG